MRVCKANYPYIPSGNNLKCPVCGHFGYDHRHSYGRSVCYKCSPTKKQYNAKKARRKASKNLKKYHKRAKKR